MTLSSDKNDAVIEEYRRVPWSCPVMWALLCHVQPCVQQQCLLIHQQREIEGVRLLHEDISEVTHQWHREYRLSLQFIYCNQSYIMHTAVVHYYKSQYMQSRQFSIYAIPCNYSANNYTLQSL